jgi:short-subunit dehydrogenase
VEIDPYGLNIVITLENNAMRSKNSPTAKPYSQQTIVITGASSGAGRAAAIRFAAMRCNLVLAARNMAVLEEVGADCETLGSKVLAVPTDVTDSNAVLALAQQAAELTGAIDVWINNAGVLAVGALNDVPMGVHEQVIRTNLLGYMHGAYAVLPRFKQQGYGILINNISVGGFLPVAYGSSYSASKFGLRGFFEALQSELSPYPHIHVCNMYPAFLDTPGIQHAANYTGAYAKPAPPVFDPMRVAEAMVRLAKDPQPSTNVDPGTPFFKLAYALLPGVTRRIMEKFIRTYFDHAPALPPTDGNLFAPVSYGNAIHGGWNTTLDAQRRRQVLLKTTVIAGLLSAGFFLLSKRK